MPTNNGDITFKYGTQNAYNNLSSIDENAIYVTTDTHRIYIGGTDYTDDTQINDATKQYVDASCASVESKIGDVVDEKIGDSAATTTEEWLTEHVTPVGSAVVVDNSLTISGAAADAKSTGDYVISTHSELVNARIGVDGTVYESAGSAVREQIDSLNDAFQDFKSQTVTISCGEKSNLWSAIESISAENYKTPAEIEFTLNGVPQRYWFAENVSSFSNPYYWHYDEKNTVKEVYGQAGSRYQDSDNYYYTPFTFDEPVAAKTDIFFRNNVARIRGLRCYDINNVVCQYASTYIAAGVNHYVSSRDMVKKLEVCQTTIAPASSYLPPVYAYYIKPDDTYNPLSYNLIDKTKISTDGKIWLEPSSGEAGYLYNFSNTNDKAVVSGFIPVKPNTLYSYYLKGKGNYASIITAIPCFNENYELLEFTATLGSFSSSSDQFCIMTPDDCAYVYLPIATSNNISAYINNPADYTPIFCEYRFIESAIDSQNITKITQPEIAGWLEPDFTNKTVWVFGDSWTERAGKPNYQLKQNKTVGGQDWTTYLYQKCQFKELDVFAKGGATISDTSDTLSETGNNTFIAQLNTALAGCQNNTYSFPDVVLVMGYVNDINANPARYVTENEINGTDYDRYMTETFFAKNDNDTYGNTYLVPLSDVPCNKIAGAMRYIVEKIGDIAVQNNIDMPYFLFFDAAQMANVTPFAQEKCRKDYKWMCDKLNIPFVDIKTVNAPMLWDIKTKNGDTLTPHHYWLADGTHPFTNNSVTLGQQRYALAVYKAFINNVRNLL